MRTLTLLILLVASPALAGWNLSMAKYVGQDLTELSVLYSAVELAQCGELLSYVAGWSVGKHSMSIRMGAHWTAANTYEATLEIPNTTITYQLMCYEEMDGTT